MVWNVFPEGEEPIVLIRDYTLSLHERASLRKVVETIIGRVIKEDEEYDISKISNCFMFLSVVHKISEAKKRTYARIDALVRPRKMDTAPKSAHPPIVWSIDDGSAFPDLPYEAYLRGSLLKAQAEVCHEWRDKKNGKVAAGKSEHEYQTPFDGSQDNDHPY